MVPHREDHPRHGLQASDIDYQRLVSNVLPKMLNVPLFRLLATSAAAADDSSAMSLPLWRFLDFITTHRYRWGHGEGVNHDS